MIQNNSIQNTFWIEGEKGIKIHLVQLRTFLETNGFFKVKEKKSYNLVKVEGKFVYEISDFIVAEFIRDYLKEISRQDVEEVFSAKNPLTTHFFNLLEDIEVEINMGSPEVAYLYFNNGFLEITSENINLKPYVLFEGLVWKSQVVQRDFHEDLLFSSEFGRFMLNISGNDKNRFKSLQSIIGYLLHTYKDKSETRAVILVDEKLNNNGEANGGTGKSIIGKALSYLTPTVEIDGKSINFSKRFFYSRVQSDTRIMIFDDVKANFDFENLYSVITGDLILEAKYKNEEEISFDNSPKILISSNSMVLGTGGNSDERRRIDFELAPYYGQNRKITSDSEFGHRFFDDWNNEEWSKFFSCMAHCIQLYLKYGLVKAIAINLVENRLIQETSMDFIEFADIKLMEKIREDKRVLYEIFINDYNTSQIHVTTKTFKKWLDLWAKARGRTINHFKSNSKAMLEIL